MRPGVIVRDGFLGDDARSLSAILEADEATVARLGFTHAALAARMRQLRDAGLRGLGEPIRVEDHFEVRVDTVRGALPCPFGERGLHAKTFTIVRNLNTGRELTYADLSIHLIATHGFYEGRGSPFRLEPEEIVAVLEPKRVTTEQPPVT